MLAAVAKTLLPKVRHSACVAVLLLAAVVQPVRADLLDDARSNSTAAVLAAIADKADVNVRSSDGTSALHWAVYNGNAALVRALLSAH